MKEPVQSNSTPAKRVCVWHLRRIFNEARIWEKFYTYELDMQLSEPKPKDFIDRFGSAVKWSQEVLFTDPANGNRQVARCHWYLGEDWDFICGSGAPDPKELDWESINYRIHKDGRLCELCESGDRIVPPESKDVT